MIKKKEFIFRVQVQIKFSPDVVPVNHPSSSGGQTDWRFLREREREKRPRGRGQWAEGRGQQPQPLCELAS